MVGCGYPGNAGTLKEVQGWSPQGPAYSSITAEHLKIEAY